MKEGRYQAATTVYSDWLDRFEGMEGVGRLKDKRKQADDAPTMGKVLLLMAPMSGEFGEIGKSLREGALLAVDEHNQKGGPRVDTRIVDDQGNLIVGIHRLRKALREEKVDALIGPAMSDVSAAAAVDLSARKSPIPMVTPTATTHGIAALGDGIFQLNVTTGTLGQKIASYAVSCLKLSTFAIVAPESEYGYQLAEAFQRTVERKGGSVISVQYFVPGSTDMNAQFQEVRKAALKLWLEKRKAEGMPDPDSKEMQKIVSDTTIPIDGIFLPATNGEEANVLAGSFSFSRMKGQVLGSSGWNDKALLHKSGTAHLGAYFSVDFQENPKTDAYLAFSRAFSARWKRQPDKVSALAYDAARFVLQGLTANPGEGALLPGLRQIRGLNGVLGRITFDEKYGANANAALYQVEKRGFKETETCPEAE
jgi:ABC-type branched-subunit amino acid transport system substrate-binding protein